MSRSTILFAVSTPQEVGPIEAAKVARITTAFDARLELFHCVFDSHSTQQSEFAPERTEEQIQRLVSNAHHGLQLLADQFHSLGVPAKVSIRWDHPVHEGIVRQVLRRSPRLLIAQSSPRDPLTRALLSQTDRKLIETCPSLLLLLKTHRPYCAPPLIVAAVDPGHAHDKPAVLDEHIVDAALRLTEALAGKLVLFHARTPWEEALRADPDLWDLPEYQDEQFHRDYLDRVDASVVYLAERHGLEPEQVHVEDGHAAERLPHYAGAINADIVVMGAVSRSRLRRMIIGHTAERVLDTLPSDILIVKPPDFKTTVRRESAHLVHASLELPSP